MISLLRARIAAIVPSEFSQAFCIAFALTETSFRPSSKLKTSDATRAENSPRE